MIERFQASQGHPHINQHPERCAQSSGQPFDWVMQLERWNFKELFAVELFRRCTTDKELIKFHNKNGDAKSLG